MQVIRSYKDLIPDQPWIQKVWATDLIQIVPPVVVEKPQRGARSFSLDLAVAEWMAMTKAERNRIGVLGELAKKFSVRSHSLAVRLTRMKQRRRQAAGRARVFANRQTVKAAGREAITSF